MIVERSSPDGSVLSIRFDKKVIALSRWSRGYISTSPFHPTKVPSLRREGPWSRSCVVAWQPTQMSPHQNDQLVQMYEPNALDAALW